MATEYSGEVAVGTYNRIRIKCDYSGTSATLTIQFRRTSGYSTTWYSDYATLTFNGQTKSAAYSYSGYVGTDWVDLRSSISGYSISASGGTYSWNFYDGAALGCSGSITLSSQGSAPSGGYIEGVSSYWDNGANEIVVKEGRAGVTSDGGSALSDLAWYLTEIPYISGASRRRKAITNGGSATLSNSTSDNTTNTIDIAPNKLLYNGLYASNSAGEYRYQGPTVVTAPAPFQVSINNISYTTATVDYATTNDGGYYAKNFEYSLDGGYSWQQIELVTGSTIVEHSYQLTGLTPGNFYTIKTRVSTPAGTTACNETTFCTLDNNSEFYCPVFNQATSVTGFYGSVNNQAAKIYKIYCSRNGRAVPFWIKHT